MPTRRDVLRHLACGAAASVAPSIRLAFAAAPTEQRFVLVLLRGALDGLAAVPPFGDPAYESQRQGLAVASPRDGDGALDLDGFFGLHPALPKLHGLYGQRELLVVHAAATPYRERSHFDGQDLLDNGTARPHGAGDGWLNRALGLLGGDRRLGLAVGPSVPLVLRGAAPVASWAPQFLPALEEDFVARLQTLYARDPMLGPTFAAALAARAMSDDIVGDETIEKARLRGAAAVRTAAEHVGALLADARGPRLAALEIGGWDTHAGQGVLTGRLAGQLARRSSSSPSSAARWRPTAPAGRTTAPAPSLSSPAVRSPADASWPTGPGWRLGSFTTAATCGRRRTCAACSRPA